MEKILIIKRDNKETERLREILDLAGYDVYTSSYAVQGIRNALNIGPDFILCDIAFSNPSGSKDVLTSIRKSKNTAYVPFVFLGTDISLQEQHRGIARGADDYLEEPVDSVDLLNTIAIRLEKSHKFVTQRKLPFSSFKERIEGYRILDQISKHREIRTYGSKEIIFGVGQYVRYLYILKSGRVKQSKANQGGKELVTDIFSPGDFFGTEALVFDMPSKTSAVAIEACRIQLIPKEVFLQALTGEPYFDALILNHLALSIQHKEEKLLSIAYDSVRKRIADALLQLSEDPGGKKGGVQMLQEDISQLVGSATESVSRTLSEFRSKNYIEMSSGRIHILQRERLANILN
ncbi:MAG: cyclic nucleotide-binding domain-containing protein [Saprospiraceae bacterium]|nr:cyclic nucleotide-binding domain-containing protein [Saprospiraceae bacterium]